MGWSDHEVSRRQLWGVEYEPQMMKVFFRRKDCWSGNSAEESGGHIPTHQLWEVSTISVVSSGSSQEVLGLLTEEAKVLGEFVENGMGIPDVPVERLMIKEE